MLDKLTGKSVHLWVHRICLMGIAIGLPWSKVPVGLGMALMAFNFLLQGNFKTSFQHWKENKPFVWLLLFYGLLLLSLLWTDDFHFAGRLLKAMIGLVALPIMITARPEKNALVIKWIVGVFVISCFITTFINIGYYQHWWGNKTYNDIRGLSLFGSHVRYALLIVMASVITGLGFFQKGKIRWFSLFLCLWFLYYTFFSQVISGYLALIFVGIVFGLKYWSTLQQRLLKWSTFIGFSSVLVVGCVFVLRAIQPIPPKITPENWPKKTMQGNPYTSDNHPLEYENGFPILACICDEELRSMWNKTSQMDYDTGRTITGEPVRWIILRYMTSKGLLKDSVGFTKLTPTDIQHIENGVPSIRLTRPGFFGRLAGIQDQLQRPQDPNGHSLLERLEFWKNATRIIRNHPIIGVGVGDLDRAFQSSYIETKSLLKPEFRHRAHNQFLTVWIAAGIVGLLVFVIWWGLQFRMAWKSSNWLWLGFVTIALSSFLTEDTLETQVGAVFIGFFFGLFSNLSKIVKVSGTSH